METHPFETLLPGSEELYKDWIQLTWALDRKFTDLHSPTLPKTHHKAVKATRRKLSHIMRKRFSGAFVSLYGTFPLGLDQLNDARHPIVHMSLQIPALLQLQQGNDGTEEEKEEACASKSKRFLFQALHVLQRRQHQDVIHLKAFPGAHTPYLMGTYGYDESSMFVHFELAITKSTSSVEENTALLQQYMRLDRRVQQLLQLILLWSETVPSSSLTTAKLGPYDYLTMGIHYLIWIGFVPDLSEGTQQHHPRRKARPSLHHLSSAALLYGFFCFYAHFPWSSRIVGLNLGEEHDSEMPSLVQMDDFSDRDRCILRDVSLFQRCMEENRAYWESLVLKREPAQTDQLWLPKPPPSLVP